MYYPEIYLFSVAQSKSYFKTFSHLELEREFIQINTYQYYNDKRVN
jgi:hypothetical protein